MKIIFKIVIFNIAGVHQPPWLWLLNLPLGKVVPNFFHQNDRKGGKRDYVGVLGNFL